MFSPGPTEEGHRVQTTTGETIMRKLGRRNRQIVLIAAAIILGMSLIGMSRNVRAAGAESQQAVQLNVNSSMADNLAAFKGKSVTVILSSGQTMTGVVNDVKGNLLHLAKLSQKEFYDALVAIDRISAIEVRAR